MYEPWDALAAPRVTGPRTYARLPYVKDLEGVDAAVFAMPWGRRGVVSLGNTVRPRRDSLGFGMSSRWRRSVELQVLSPLPVRDVVVEALPLVSLVAAEHLVHRRAEHLARERILIEGVDRLKQVSR